MGFNLFLLAGILCFSEEIWAKEAKYLVDIEYIQQCPEPEYTAVETPVNDLKIYKLNRTVKAFNFNLTLKRPWDADVGFKMELDTWAYAGWTHLPYIPIQRDVCQKLKTMFRDSSTNVMENLGLKKLQQCPLQPGLYTVRNYTSVAFGMNFPFTGRFRIRTIILSIKTKQVILCSITIINIGQNLSTM